MPIYYGSQKLGDLYIGSTKINEVYKGSIKVYSSSQYKPDQVIFESAIPSTYSLDLLDTGKYEVYCIGGGGHGSWTYNWKYLSAGGGSGAGFIGIISLNSNTYSIKVGNIAEDSNFANLIISYQGGNASGSGGTLTVNTSIVSSSLYTNGNSGIGNVVNGYAAGGTSVWNGYGKGESYSKTNIADNATAGYVKIVYKGK